jgi:uncharacterized damage-inducible protein DinB
MKQHLIDTFKYNDWANKKLLEAILQLPDKQEPIRLFSHLITAQDKWFNRITKEVDDAHLNWFGTVFAEEELSQQWQRSVGNWINYIEKNTEDEFQKHIQFSRPDGKAYQVTIKDVMLQLNYHSMHHRAQINTLIRQQGIKPPLTDYIFTAIKEVR